MRRSAEALSADWLREQGYQTDKCSWWQPFSRRRKDLYGFADLEAFDPKGGAVVLVQATDWANVAHRRQKILASPIARAWVAHFPRYIWILGWKQNPGWKKRGEAEFLHKVLDIRAADFFREEKDDVKAQG